MYREEEESKTPQEWGLQIGRSLSCPAKVMKIDHMGKWLVFRTLLQDLDVMGK